MTRARDVANIDTILTAKGDMYAATAAFTPARLAVGSNGDTLVADSAATTGLRWSGGTTLSNPVINSSFEIWQRGTSFTATGSTSDYGADRWNIYNGRTGTTYSRQVTNDTTNLPNIQYAMRVQRNSGNTATGDLYLTQFLETANSIPYAGKTITFSFYARAGANYSGAFNNLIAQVRSGTGTDQNIWVAYTGSSTFINSTATLTTTWQRFTATATVATTATELAILFAYTPTGTAGAADFFEVTGVQIDVGQTALPYRRTGGTIQGELAACQRYLPTIFIGTELSGYAYGTNTAAYFYNFPVNARVAPTGITVAGTINAYALNVATGVTPTFNSAGVSGGSVLAGHTITAGQGSRLLLSTGSSILFTGCEL